MNRKPLIVTFMVLLIMCVEGRRTSSSRSRGSGSGSGSGRRSNPHPSPTLLSYPQASAPKPSLSGWQESAKKTQTLSSWQSKPSSGQGHSYPSSNTGLSGTKPKQPPSHQESVQRSSAPSNSANQQTHTQNQPSHSYPSSNGLSGSPGSGYQQQNAYKYPQQQGTGLSGSGQPAGYPQQHGPTLPGNGQPGGGYPQQHGTGLSGTGSSQPGSGYPQQHGIGMPGSGSGQPGGYPQNHGSGLPGSGYPQQTGVGLPYHNNPGSNNYHPQAPPPPYSPSYGGFGGHGQYNPGYSPQTPGYFGNYGSPGKGYGGVSRTGSALKGVGIAGAGIGTVLTGLALWNLARSTGHSHHTVIYDQRGQPVAVAPSNGTAAPAIDPILADLVNCTLSISNGNSTEVLAIPCAIATSFTPDADVKESHINENPNDNTKCTVTVVTKSGKEFMTTIPCSTLLNTAAENNVTEPSIAADESGNISNITNGSADMNTTIGSADLNTTMEFSNNGNYTGPTALKLTGTELDVVNNNTLPQLNCDPHPGEIRDPINPCYSVQHNLTVIPLSATDALVDAPH